MKKLLKTLSFLGLSLSLSMHAQTSSGKAKPQAAAQNDAKTAYISSQSYLSASSVAAYNNYYGDSLKGFDEAKTTKEVLAKGMPGWEAQIYLHHLKRRFINQKYNIGPNYQYMPVPTGPPATGKNGKLGSATVNFAPCVNEDFESTPPGAYTTSNAVTGWTISSRINDGSCSPNNWTPGSNEFWILQTPILSWGSVGGVMGIIPGSPLGGSNVAQLNDQINNVYMTRIAQQFPVTQSNSLFQFAYAGYWNDGGPGHDCCLKSGVQTQPGLTVSMFDCNGAPLACSSLSLSPGPSCQSNGVNFNLIPGVASWSNWQVKSIDLTPYIGSCVTIEFVQSDCAFGGHWGSVLIDTRCGGNVLGPPIPGPGGTVGGPVSFCAGTNLAQIAAPSGYVTYQWFAPNGSPIAAPQGTAQVLNVPNPQTGDIYTVKMTLASGCVFTATNQISTSTVSIVGLGSTTTCAGGSAGSATVIGNGSGTGYNYTWINAQTSATVGTTAVVNGLAAGVYSVILTGFGAAGCGSAVATTTVNTGIPSVTKLSKPFCGSEAYFGVLGTGGSKFQWYKNSSPIPAPFGTAPSLTVSPPVAGDVITIAYTNYGCRDSIEYTLFPATPGQMGLSGVSRVCPNGANGTAQVTLTPAANAPSGFNSYVVTSIGNTPPYTASLFPTSSNIFNLSGLAGGTYSVSVFDGSCKYNTTFNVVPFVFNYTLSATAATLCPGNSVASAISFSSPVLYGQFTYSWTPTTNLFGATSSNAIITPSLPPVQQATTVYSVIVTPTLINCPVVKTVTVTAINPPTPTITAIPNLCNTFAPYQILTTPPGGTFYTGTAAPNNPISPQGGVITPSLAANGLNSFTYAASVYTCVAKSTATYQVSKFWTSALSSTVPPLCVTSPNFNITNIVQNTQNGVWLGQGQQVSNVGGAYYFNPSGLNTGNYTITYSTSSTPNPTVCPSTTTLNVAVTNTSVPSIVQVPEFCTNAAPINISASPAGGGWLPVVNSAISKQGVITPTLMPVPGIVATYTVSDGPCVNSNTVQLKVSKYYSAGFSGTVVPLCFNSKPVNLMSIVQNTTNGSWSTGGLGVSSNSFFPASLPTGIYTATYNTASSPNLTLCPDSRTINISVLNPVTPTITQVSAMCNNAAPIQLSVTPNNGYWTASPYLSSNGVFTPSLTSVGNNAVQYVVGTNTCNVKDNKIISVEAFVPATITGKLPNLCNTSPIFNLAPFTLSGSGVWSGAGISGTSFNPAATGAGEFVLTHHTASSPSGLCPDVANITVKVFSLAVPAVTPVDPMCNTALPFQLKVSPIGGIFGGPDMNIISLAGKFNPAAALIGDNVINYSITSGPCIAYAQTVIKVEKFISADLAKPVGPFCRTEEPVDLNSYVLNPGGKWFQGADESGLVGTSMFHPSLAMLDNNNHLTYRTNSIPSGLCPDEKKIVVNVRKMPSVEIYAEPNGACVPVAVNFHIQNGNSGNGLWTIGDGSEAMKGLEGSHVFTTPGSYTIQFNYTDEIGCKALPVVSRAIEVNPLPKADFSVPEEIYITDPNVQMNNQSTVLENNKYEWHVSGLSTEYHEIHPVINLPEIGKYQVTLNATSAQGCKDQVTKIVEVKNNFNLFIPNSFSPNFDGLNDVFLPVYTKEGLDLKYYEMEIFDRWGHSLFRSKDITKGWDGLSKSEPLKQDVYVYKIRYRDADGNNYEKIGNVSLLK